MKTATRRRARRAIRILKLLAAAKIHPDGVSLSGGRFFNSRCLDDCFEAGDGTEVVVLIMQACRTDEALRRAFRSGLSSRFVDLDGWSRTLADWEARQPAPLPHLESNNTSSHVTHSH
ncbi:hypothetical protein OH491_24705 [Termitidicoccus mucosus]|uniref:Uncharacterized protein n=1 Tax=Termitidicoccus mucosus TaxID=1184151 RepID=A0A178IQN0_9BACT|nr:hypothetical protein AW736_01810 [Opitutaceae bacterium TSB47]